MTVAEIFKEISNHMIYGLMFHEQQADMYDFLNLKGYKRMSEYHFFCETKNMRELHRYYLNHFNRLIEEGDIDNPNVIPMAWYGYLRQDVDANTKRSAVRTGVESWVDWETKTKDFYQQMYKELMDLGEVAAANKISCFLCGVDKELKHAQRHHINLKSADFSIDYMLFEQDNLHDCYKEKMKEMFHEHRGDK